MSEVSRKSQKSIATQILPELRQKVKRMIIQLDGRSPHFAIEGIYDDMPLDWWTSGFWPGILWVMYDLTKEEQYCKAAWDWDRRLEEFFIKENDFNHDVGFQFLPTAVIKYKLTGDRDAKRRGWLAASYLAGRFNAAGNFLRAWNQQDDMGLAIVDTAMNLSLLFWAGEEFGDPRFGHIAKATVETLLRHFIREDGSVRHIVSFDPETGAFIESLGGQGYGPDSAWSRGQAWTLYGMANAYRYTGEIRYLRAAQRVAHFFITALPENKVPYWDFRLPSNEGEPLDTSAAACAASGLLAIANQLPALEGRIYYEWAEAILASLTANFTTFKHPEYEGILTSGTGNKPKNWAVNVSLIYGDFFYAEGIAKLSGLLHPIF
jgi:unsaturated chondroitin disaccharide hydrolase